MEKSFVEYRNQSGLDSDSDTEIIDDSLVEDRSFVRKKQTAAKNETVFVAESEESVTEDETEEEETQRLSKSVVRRSSAKPQDILSSDDDTNRRGSIRRSTSPNRVILSSSDEEETSPEVLKRRPNQPSRLSESFIGRKTKKRMMVLDSDTDNSIIVEHNRHKKLVCLKDTPAKIESSKIVRNKLDNVSFQEDEGNITNDSDNDESGDDDQHSTDGKDDEEHESSEANDKKDTEAVLSNDARSSNEGDGNVQIGFDEDDDDGPDEDQMVFSRATRMSIMGMIPKENDSDDSDYIQSDDTNHTSHGSLTNTTTDLPESNLPTHTPQKEIDNCDTSRLTCSPFGSPLQDITKEINNSIRKSLKGPEAACEKPVFNFIKPKPLSELLAPKVTENVIDDDVTIIDTKPEIIALSSDDEDEMPVEKKSPNLKKSAAVKSEKPTPKKAPASIKQYLVPPSYPNQVVYVKKSVRENELSKLNGLKEELQNIRYLLEHMAMETLPDGGAKLIERLSALEADVRRQGDKVANMVVEPDEPTAEDIAKDGFDPKEKTPSWDDIQKAGNAVQPRMFGKHAMATHMAERNLIMERLRDLYSAMASRPAETEHASPPAALKSTLMPHQLHALAWLRWRETQRPPGGILADDMGLGKTITMISLIASDKENSIDDDDEDDEYSGKGRVIRGGTLVVCPASLMQQWAGEVGKHCSPHSLAVCLHHGAARAQQPHRLAAHDLVLTTYNILQRENEKGGVLSKISWRRAILDEAHVVRNHKSATSSAVCGLRARRRWALTGTPLHNKDLDLFALLKFLKCTPFDDLAMWKKWIDNKSLGGQERLSMMMRCVMLRRTKAQLQQRGQLGCLPPRDARDVHVTLDKDEMNVYQKVLVFSKTLFAQFLHQRAEKQDAFGVSPIEKDNAYALHKKMAALQGVKPVKSHEILVVLLRLRQVCCHCGLIAGMLQGGTPAEEDPAGRDLLAELNKLSLDDSRRKSGKYEDNVEDEEPDEGTSVAEALRSVMSPSNPVFQLERRSSKIAAVMDCLQKNVFPNKDEKAVVVSQWTSVLQLVERELGRARVRSVTLCGSVPVAARQPLIDKLNDARSDVRVMLLSLCAGGVGLNLCGASHLLLLDPHWNPQLEEQAQDRVYRVGQHKHVHIYRFMCLDTVEQTIRKLQQAKLEMADNILTGARNNNASKLTIEDLKMLFNMGATDS